jgi:hypothetical protein
VPMASVALMSSGAVSCPAVTPAVATVSMSVRVAPEPVTFTVSHDGRPAAPAGAAAIIGR